MGEDLLGGFGLVVDGPPLDIRYLRAAATNEDLAALVDAVHDLRQAFPAMRDGVAKVDALDRAARET